MIRTMVVLGVLCLSMSLGPPALFAQPPNDSCFSATPVGNGSFPFDNLGTVIDGPNTCDPNMTGDVWFLYTASSSGSVLIDTCLSAVLDDTTLIVYDWALGCPSAGSPCLASDDDSCGVSGFNSSVSISTIPGASFLIQVGGWDGSIGDGLLTITPLTGVVNDSCLGAQPVSDGIISFSNVGATLDGPITCVPSVGADIWFVYIPTTTGTATISTCGATFDTVLTAYDASVGCPPLAGSPFLACNDDSCGLASSISFPVTAFMPFLVQLGGFGGAMGTGNLQLATVSVPTPVFLRGDADGNGCVEPIPDLLFLNSVLFPGMFPPPVLGCLEAADTNDDGLINIADSVALLAYGFPVGPPQIPPAPGPFVCGPDPTPSLGCASYVCAPCVPPPPDPNVVLTLVAGPAPAIGPVSAQVLLDTDQPLAGLSFGVCHSAQVVGPSFVNQGPALAALNGGSGPGFFNVQVAPGQGWAAGIIVSFTGADTLPPSVGAPIILTEYSCTGAGAASLAFCDNIGSPPVPISASAPGGATVTPLTLGTTVACGPPPPGSFVRGDVSGDGVLDSSDVAFLEQFLFPGILPFGPPPEPLGCDLVPNQSGDINDNELETIADLLMFMEYLNCGGISIPGPSTCGDDPDDFDEGFGTIDDCYMLSAFTISVTGDFDEERDVDVLLQIRAPESIKAASFGLLLGSELSLNVGNPLTLAGGVTATMTGVLVEGDFIVVGAGNTACSTPMITLSDLTCPPTFPTFVPFGTLHLKLAPFAIFPPIQLVQEATVEGHIRRTTIVDMFFDDHQPRFLSGEAERFARGNANNFDSLVDIADPIYILDHLFNEVGEIPAPLLCRDAADSNNDGNVDIADAIYVLSFLFAGGQQPPAPFPVCGFDQDIDEIDLEYPPELRCEDPLCL